MKKYLQALLVASVLLTLTACGRLKDSDLSSNSTTSLKKSKTYQTTDTGSTGYNVLLKNGKYVTSDIDGITATNKDNSVDEREFQRGLVAISKNVYPTGTNVFQEGQYLDSTTVNNWLGRRSKNNPAGLNPAVNGSKAASSRNPIYLEELQEQNYLTGSGSSYHLSGLSIGLALNSSDYYQKTTDGPYFSTSISRANQRSYGERTAETVIARLRRRKALKNVPITIGLFSKTDQDSLVGGSYFAYGTASANSSKITKWKPVSEKWQVLPTVGSAKAYSSSDESKFTNFKGAIENYFPNVSGVIGYLRYQDKKLVQENIAITTQFYGYEQVQSFTRLVESCAKKYLSNDTAVEIKIGSVNDVQALVFKESADSAYQVHIYGGE
ncbi:MAG: CamS family sex pheromone protein [Lactobacillus sp.]|nr:CamS family sex pheromone protein [Lactobacillus sp.]MDN6052543.1 CamS family sex pheromone protein [Lactobacillus sp.]